MGGASTYEYEVYDACVRERAREKGREERAREKKGERKRAERNIYIRESVCVFEYAHAR